MKKNHPPAKNGPTFSLSDIKVSYTITRKKLIKNPINKMLKMNREKIK